ncbi:MAG: NH(3)-dependent NAD(+) synthetase [Fimbriimonadales bacterium]|nr:MAG: NH(3)-dependent NAD(+) synthetase [Fimbriimonadales bacterium]
MQTFPVMKPTVYDPSSDEPLRLNAPLVTDWLIEFLRDEVGRRRGFSKALLGLSGGVDSALVAYLCARAFGAENVYAFLMPYKISSPQSLEHGMLVVHALGIHHRVIEITPMVDAYLERFEPDANAARIGNICARTRMIILFDQSAKLNALPIGTGNKSERLFGYFTWHADDAPPVNPIGDLFKTQVWQLARYLGVPEVIVEKPASADLIVGQTDEGDFGISYQRADRILHYLIQGFSTERLIAMGFPAEDVRLVKQKVDSTHWKRHLPTVAMLSTTAIGEYYLRPVDF